MKIATLTISPALDKSTVVDRIQSEQKLRCEKPSFEPGGGGINVSRAIKIMGGESLAIYAAGGPEGDRIESLLEKEGVDQHRIKTEKATRENLLVMETSTSNHFRFGMPGSELSQNELERCLDAIYNLPDGIEFLVASGSLPPRAPEDFYGQIADIAREKNIECLIDTSGKPLLKAVESGVCLLKPNLSELGQLAGKDEITGMEQEEIAGKIIKDGKADYLIVSLGARGAMLATKDTVEYIVPPSVKQTSTVGAGDSMVAGIILSLSRGERIQEAIRWGVAAGTAATITPGTELCRKEDVEKIFEWINS